MGSDIRGVQYTSTGMKQLFPLQLEFHVRFSGVHRFDFRVIQTPHFGLQAVERNPTTGTEWFGGRHGHPDVRHRDAACLGRSIPIRVGCCGFRYKTLPLRSYGDTAMLGVCIPI